MNTRFRIPIGLWLLALLLGLATNLGIAWYACNRRIPMAKVSNDLSGLAHDSRPTWHVRRWNQWGYTTQNFSPVERTGGSYQRERYSPELVSYWSRTAVPPPENSLDKDSMNYIWYSEVAAGWPMRTVICDWTNDGRNYSKPGGMAGPRRGGWKYISADRRTEMLFPYRPIWPGFLVNTALFSMSWLFVLLVPGAVRRARRRRAGRCVACGYDRRGLADAVAPCPECGATPSPRPTPAAA